MKWFKLYHNADSSLKLGRLIDMSGVEGYGRYLLLLQLLCEKTKDESGFYELHENEILAKVRIKFSKKLITFMQLLSDFSLIKFKIDERVWKIEAPIMLELKQKDFRKKQSSRNTNAKKPPLRIKNKEERIKNIKNNKKETISDSANLSTAQDWIDEINNHLGKNFTLKPYRKNIAVYIESGYTIDDLRSVVSFKKNQWSRDPKMSQYLRPLTLLGSKFPVYVDEARGSRTNKKTSLKNSTEEAYKNGLISDHDYKLALSEIEQANESDLEKSIWDK